MIDMEGISLLPGVSALFEVLISPRMLSPWSSNLFRMMLRLSDDDIRLGPPVSIRFSLKLG